MDICTIVARNYLAAARVLARSFAAHHPGGRCWTLVIDDRDGEIDPSQEPFELLTPAELDIDPWPRMAAGYSVLELSTAVKPWLLRHLLGVRGLSRVAYLDPDIQFFGSIEDVDDLLRTHSVLVNPHITEPVPRDGRRPSETDILVAGAFNLGFAGFAAGPEVDALLDWWAERLETDCLVAPERGYFVDQRWMDFAPGLVASLYVLRDPGYNVAYWNLHSRRLEQRGDAITVNGRPLRFFHFSGYDPQRPHELSKHQNRIQLDGQPLLRTLCDGYARALADEDHAHWRSRPYSWDALPDGTRLDAAARLAFRQAVKAGLLEREDIFSDEGALAFSAYLRAPAPRGGLHGVSNYLHSVWESRPDLQAEFPKPAGNDGARLATWARANPDQALPERLGEAMAGAQFPVVRVTGYHAGVMGVGEHARQLTAALRSQHIPISRTTLRPHAAPEDERLAAGIREEPSLDPNFNLLCVNADSVEGVVRHLGREFFAGRYTIGFWAWEVRAFPARFAAACEYVDEVWVGSRHVRDAVAPLATVPVIVIPQPVSLPDRPVITETTPARSEPLRFLFAFDYLSVFERKNPLATVEAFTRAFAPGEGASLTIKCLNSDFDPAAHARLREAAAAHPDVSLLERRLSAEERDRLMAETDCYVSLHRAEGFGYTLAEAMWLGKPVIATGYSGNTDYMTSENSYLVDYSLVPIGSGHDPYPSDGMWAAPDVEQAAQLMREVFEGRAEARLKGERAARDIRASHGPQAAGQVMADRLQLLLSSGAVSAAWRRSAGPLATGRVAALIEDGPRPPRHPRFGTPQRLARKGLLRLLKPLAVHERLVDGELLRAVESLEARLSALDATHAVAMRQIDGLRADLAATRDSARADVEQMSPGTGEVARAVGDEEAKGNGAGAGDGLAHDNRSAERRRDGDPERGTVSEAHETRTVDLGIGEV